MSMFFNHLRNELVIATTKKLWIKDMSKEGIMNPPVKLTTDEPGNYNGNYFCMKPSPCGRLYVAGGFFAQIKIFDCKDNREMANINIGKNICFDLSLSSEYLFY